MGQACEAALRPAARLERDAGPSTMNRPLGVWGGRKLMKGRDGQTWEPPRVFREGVRGGSRRRRRLVPSSRGSREGGLQSIERCAHRHPECGRRESGSGEAARV